MEKERNKFFDFVIYWRLKIAMLVVLAILVVYYLQGNIPLDIVDFSNPLGPIGAWVVLLGAFLRSWAAGIIKKKARLTVEGPYSLFRHPLYIGSLLLAVGYALILNYLWLWIVIAAFVLFIYVPKIFREEKDLAKAFPKEWNDFTRNTAILFPKRPSMKKILYPWSLTQWFRNKEYNGLLTSVLGLALLALWQSLMS